MGLSLNPIQNSVLILLCFFSKHTESTEIKFQVGPCLAWNRALYNFSVVTLNWRYGTDFELLTRWRRVNIKSESQIWFWKQNLVCMDSEPLFSETPFFHTLRLSEKKIKCVIQTKRHDLKAEFVFGKNINASQLFKATDLWDFRINFSEYFRDMDTQ